MLMSASGLTAVASPVTVDKKYNLRHNFLTIMIRDIILICYLCIICTCNITFHVVPYFFPVDVDL